MTPLDTRLSSAAGTRLRSAIVFLCAAGLASCDAGGPRTGKLSLTVSGLPSTTAAQITLKNGTFTRTVSGSEIVANLKPGNYTIKAASVFDGATRYSAAADSQMVTITKSEVPVDASVSYAVSNAVMTVNLAGAPTGATAAVRVTGPNAFSQTIAATTTFNGIEPGSYFVIAPEITSSQQRFVADRATQQVNLVPAITPTRVFVTYAQITGNLTFAVTGLPAGVAGDISVTGPVASYVVGASSDLVGVRAGQYTVTVKPVQSGTSLYVPNFGSQIVTLNAGGTVVVNVSYTSSDGPLNLTVDGLTITQVVQTYGGTVPLVAGRDAFLRVFARANQQNNVTAQVRVRVYSGETLVNTITLFKGAGIPLLPDQSTTFSSWNGILLGQYIQPGLRILADVDPDNTITEASETDNGFPASGTPATINVREVAPLRLTFVPIVQRFDKALVGNVTDANKEQFLGDVRRMLPVLDIDAQVHAPYTTSDSLELTSNDGNNEWIRVLNEMNALRIAESSQRHYFGIVKVSYNSGIAGYGFVPGRAAVGWDYLPSGRNVMAHELGHNFSRLHAPCGGVGGPDPSYPYAGGTIGAYGYDMSTNLVRLPTSPDLMGYCNSPWISDYNYVGAMDWRTGNPTPDVSSAAVGLIGDAAPRPALLVWGRVERGQLVLEPSFSIVAKPSLPTSGGPYRIEGIGANGQTLFSYQFAGEQPADAPDPTARHFAFAIPMDETTQGQLASVRLSGGGRQTVVMSAGLAPQGISASVATVDATRASSGRVRLRLGGRGVRMALIRDARTGQILSFARGGTAEIRSTTGDLDVSLSDGVRSASRRVRVANR